MKHYTVKSIREFFLGKLIYHLRAMPMGQIPSTPFLIAYALCWGNPGYAASIRYLRRICKTLARGEQAPILECGSGSSTLLMGAMAERYGRKITSLEHHEEWTSEMHRLVDKFQLHAIQLYHAPLTDYGNYSWYDVPSLDETRPFGFVVCDGPPKRTPGGRFGLLPTMEGRLAKNCTILLDDTHRQGEKEILKAWELRQPCRQHNFYAVKGFTEVVFI